MCKKGVMPEEGVCKKSGESWEWGWKKGKRAWYYVGGMS